MAAAVASEAPPVFLQLAAHPVRWRLLRELARSDRTVQELTAAVGEAQSLVSYHLGKLRAAGVASSRRSSADARDSYYTLDLVRVGRMLDTTAAVLHPALDRPDAAASRSATRTVLFVCTGNSARSQMAEALARHRAGGLVDACSAGSNPKPLHPNALRAMREVHGIDLGGHEPTHLDAFAGRRFDAVVTLCDRVREVCPEFPGRPDVIHWSIADPAAGGVDDDASYPAFRRLADELDVRVGMLVALLTSRDTGSQRTKEEP